VKKDLDILMKNYALTTYHFKTKNKILTPLSFLLQAIHLLFLGWRYDVLVMFFSGYHSVLPCLFARMTRKRSIIFLGGTDCFMYPSFNYGNFTKPLYGKSTCISAHNASLLVPVSENLIYSESDYYTVDSTVQGIAHWCKPLDTEFKIIPLEYNTEIFYRRDVERKPNSFLTVAFGIQGTSFIRKGIDKVIMVASHFPEYDFTILGCHQSEFPVPVPNNVTLIPPVPYEELPLHYSRHEFYFQLSIAEGFPSAICEAMLCECIPIGSNVAAIPSIISGNGFLVFKRDDQKIIESVKKAVSSENKEEISKQARSHIMATYGKGKREEELLGIIN